MNNKIDNVKDITVKKTVIFLLSKELIARLNKILMFFYLNSALKYFYQKEASVFHHDLP